MDLPAPLDQQLDALLAEPATSRPVTADDRYHDLRQEVDKLGSVTGASVDWRAVATLGTGLTRELGKDLNVLAYTTFACHRLRDLPGALVGVVALGRLLTAPPATLTPAKPRARAGAIEWLLTRLQLDLSDMVPTPGEAAQLRAVHAALRELRSTTRHVLGDMCPSFTPVLQAIDRIAPEQAIDDPTPTAPDGANDLSTSNAADASTSPPGSPAATILTSPTTDAPTRITSASPDPRSDAVAATRTRAATWLAPISAESPCGADPAGLEPFADAREELAKLSSVSGEPVDWARVETRCAAILREHAKDLRVAAWFALARFHREGLPGLALGLGVLTALLDDLGDDLHPRRAKPRRELADWLIRQSAAAVLGVAAVKLRAEPLAELGGVVERLGLALRARLADDAPSMRPLREALRQADEALAALAPAPAIGPAPATSSPPDTLAAVAPSTPVTAVPRPHDEPGTPASSPGPEATPGAAAVIVPLPAPEPASALAGLADLDRFLSTTGESLQQAARTLREATPTDPRAYRLLRVGLWIHLTTSPPLRPDGNTNLPGLADRDRAQLDELATAARWPGLLNRSENLLVNHRLALDLQRHSAAALTALGPDHAAAALALRAELRALLARLPDLPTLRDRDGQPLADPATRQWLADEVDPRGTPTAAPPADPDDPEFWAGLPDALRQADRAAPLAEAQRRIDACAGEQLRCVRRLALAEACTAAGEHPLAVALFAGLADDLERRGLDRWDPPITLRCLGGLARAHQRRGELPAARITVHRLGRLDAAAAAALLADLPA